MPHMEHMLGVPLEVRLEEAWSYRKPILPGPTFIWITPLSITIKSALGYD